MEIVDAIKIVKLMRERDSILDMRSNSITHSMSGWSLMINDKKFPIPSEAKQFFKEAIVKALDQIEQEIDKL